MRLADAIQHPKWQEAMNEEFIAIKKNNTWQLTDLPKGHKAIDFGLFYSVCLWSSKKQSIVALSTCEAEYVATATSVCQSVWLSNIMTQFGFNLDVPIKIYVDNVSAINFAKNPIFHQRSKHVDNRYHFLQDQVGKNKIKLE